MSAILGVDLGERRIGLALADGPGGPVWPLATIRRAKTVDRDAEAIVRALGGRRVGELVVGLPLDIGGDAGPQARLSIAWATEIAAFLGLPLALRDERLSSHLAEGRVGPMKRGRSGGPPTPSQREAWRARVDREAAAIILQDELDARAGRSAERPATRPPRDHAETNQSMENDS